MSGTVLEHRLVRTYLSELDAATRGLPPGAARELGDQIRAHLDEALRPGAGDQEVVAVLRRLGSPADLAAEAGAASAGPGRPPTAGRVRARLARVRRRTRITVGLTAVLVVAGGWFGAARADHYLSAAPLSFQGNAGWWYPQDARHQVITTAGGSIQNTARLRPGQRQGYVVEIVNDSPVTQTIIGNAVTAPSVVAGANANGGTRSAQGRRSPSRVRMWTSATGPLARSPPAMSASACLSRYRHSRRGSCDCYGPRATARG